MAKMKRNVGDLVSGKLGNVVFVTNGKKCYVRSAPRRSIDSWSPEQILYRQRISKIAELWRHIKNRQIQDIWNKAAKEMNCYAWFVKRNINAFSVDGSVFYPQNLLVSDGNLIPLQGLTASLDENFNNEVHMNWTNDQNINPARLNDQIFALCYFNGDFSLTIDTGLSRADLDGSFEIPNKPLPFTISAGPSEWRAGDLYVYIFLSSTDNKKFSESKCFHFLIP